MTVEIEGLPRRIKARGGADQDKYTGERNRTVFNSDKTGFVSATEVREGPMGAYFGSLIWGKKGWTGWRKTGRLRTIRTFCGSPFAKWINEQCFVTRVHSDGDGFLCLSVDTIKGYRLSDRGASVEDVLSIIPDGEWIKSERKLAAVLKERRAT